METTRCGTWHVRSKASIDTNIFRIKCTQINTMTNKSINGEVIPESFSQNASSICD